MQKSDDMIWAYCSTHLWKSQDLRTVCLLLRSKASIRYTAIATSHLLYRRQTLSPRHSAQSRWFPDAIQRPLLIFCFNTSFTFFTTHIQMIPVLRENATCFVGCFRLHIIDGWGRWCNKVFLKMVIRNVQPYSTSNFPRQWWQCHHCTPEPWTIACIGSYSFLLPFAH